MDKVGFSVFYDLHLRELYVSRNLWMKITNRFALGYGRRGTFISVSVVQCYNN